MKDTLRLDTNLIFILFFFYYLCFIETLECSLNRYHKTAGNPTSLVHFTSFFVFQFSLVDCIASFHLALPDFNPISALLMSSILTDW